MPDRHTAAAAAVAPDAGDDTLREQLAEMIGDTLEERLFLHEEICPSGCGCSYMTDDPDARDCGCDGPCRTNPGWWDGLSDWEHTADALLPLIREHVAATVQGERERLAQAITDAAAKREQEIADIAGVATVRTTGTTGGMRFAAKLIRSLDGTEAADGTR